MALRTLVVDDTITYRKILGDVLKNMPEVEFAGSAPSGAIALKKLAQDPVHLVLLDVFMPDMDGVETLKRIKKEFPGVAVVMVSGATTRSADITIEALSLGAMDFIRKPDGPDAAANSAQLKSGIQSVIRLMALRQLTSAGATAPPAQSAASAPRTVPEKQEIVPPKTVSRLVPHSFGVCAIGVSTGGPEALSRLVPAFSGPLPVAILCVQHMPPMFTKSLADSLSKKSKIKVVEACEGEHVVQGVMYIAPGGHHMVVRSAGGNVVIGLNDEPPENSCRPSVDVLFRSVASTYGDRGVLAVVLTGMGNDGCNGVRSLKRKSCYCITQSEASCIVYGMPRAVDEAGLSDASLSIEMIPGNVESLLRTGAEHHES
jgi:two-component system, chemotaxis family, protein-glutamate methylesterase/glutaminase